MTKEQPLKNIRVAITRAEHQAQIQREMLEPLGAEVYHYPCIQILPLRDFSELDAALARASNGAFDWLVFTSANTVTRIAERMQQLELPPRNLVDLKIASVGPQTERRVQQLFGLQSAALPPTYTASELAKVLDVKAGEQIFLPQSSLARTTMLDALRAADAEVTQVAAYRTQIAQGGDHVPVMLWEGKIDAITFTSESTVRFFAKRLDFEQGTTSMLDDVCVACIGPVTAAAAKSLGISVQVMPTEHTLDGLHAGLIDYFSK